MKKEYIIIDSLNQWLYTGTNKKEAEKQLNFFTKLGKKGLGYENFEEIGAIVYLYEAINLQKNKTY